jgi:uncharacterized protein (TIRG00374 family)
MKSGEDTGMTVAVPAKSYWKQGLGYFVALACLVWVFHDFQFRGLGSRLVKMEWWWILPAIVFDIASYFYQGVRWQMLLRPVGRLSSIRSTQAVYAGLFANELFPLRIGELVRMFLVSRWLKNPWVAIVPSVITERFFDGIWLALFTGITAFFVPLPKNLFHAEEILGGMVIGLTVLFVYIIFLKKRTSSSEASWTPAWKPLRKMARVFERLAYGLREIGTSRYFFLSMFISSLILIFQILAYWIVMRAYGIQLSFWAGAAVLLILLLGTAVPNAPSNVGTYQFFTVIGLSIFGIEKSIAAGFSVVVFIILTIPLWIIGLWATSGSGMKLKDIREEIMRLKDF